MNDTILLDSINDYRTSQLRAAGCRRCARTRARWLKTEYTWLHRTA